MKLLKLLTIFVIIFELFFVIQSSASAFSYGPVNPYGFAAKPGGIPGSVDLVWTDDGLTNGYDVVFGTDPKKFTFGQVGVPFTKNGINQYTVRNLSPGVNYYFSLVGETNYGTNISGPVSFIAPQKGVYPSVISITPNLSGVVGIVSASGPGGPIGAYDFTAFSGSQGTVGLTWKDNGSATHYNLAYGFEPGKYLFGVTNLSFTPNTTNKYFVGSLQKGTRYYFELTSSTDSSYVSRSGPISAVAQ